MSENTVPELAKGAVLVESAKLPKDTPIITGYDWNKGRNYEELFKTFIHSGFQATNLGLAIDEVNKMVSFVNYYPKLNKIKFPFKLTATMPKSSPWRRQN